MLDKETLLTKKTELLTALHAAAKADRVTIQGEITIINAQIKALNIVESTQLKAQADIKRSRGRAENQANLARALKAGVAPQTRGLHLGEEILVHAKRLAGVLRELDATKVEPFTKAFAVELSTFIDQQKEHVKAYNTRLIGTAVEPEQEWKQTWETGRVREG